jgi:RND family efflux transporter MFP subunit
VVIKRHVDRGEWISEGETVAVIGKDDTIDIIAEVPERYIQYIKKDMPVNATVNGYHLRGNVIAVVPRGDVATRTFPVKIRTANQYSLIEGMSARVILPTAKIVNALIVPRDSIITKFGQNVVFTVLDSKASMMPVQIIGYEGLSAGIRATGLKDGMLVVVAGNERLRDEQAVVIQKTEDRGSKSEVGMRKSE